MPFVGEVSALLTAMLWSASSLILSAATQRLGPFTVNITRLILASVYLLIVIIVFRLDINLTGTQLLNLGISGVVGLTLGDTFLFRAYREIGPRVTMLIMSVAPAIAAVLAFFMVNERLSPLGVAGIIVTLAGIAIVVVDRKPGGQLLIYSAAGFFFAFVAALGQGMGLVFAKMAFLEGAVNGFVATAVRILAALLLLLPLALLTKRYQTPLQLYRTQRKGFLLTALGSIVGPFLGIALSLIAIEHTSVGIAATIMATVPVIMLPLVRYVHKERLTWRAILGACLAVVGVGLLFLRV